MILLLLMLLLCIIHEIRVLRGYTVDPQWLARHLKITAFSVSGYFYPPLSQATLNIFSCSPIDSPIPAELPDKDLLQIRNSPQDLPHHSHTTRTKQLQLGMADM